MHSVQIQRGRTCLYICMTHFTSQLCHVIRTDCPLMKQLGGMPSHNKFEFANARHYLFKCIQCCIFESNVYVGRSEPVNLLLCLSFSTAG